MKDQSLLHFVVIHKIEKNKVIVADPAEGIVTYKPEEFFQLWTGVLILLVPAPTFQKGDQTRGLFGRFFYLLLPQKRLLVSIFLTSLLFTLLGIAGSFYFKELLDEVLPYHMDRTLEALSIGIILLTVFKVFMAAFRSHLLYLSQKLDLSLLLGYYHHLLALPMNFFDTRKTGEVLSRLMDASKVRDAISGATLTIMIDSLMVVAGGIILYTQNAFLFGVAAILIPLYAAIVWAFRKPFERMNRKQMESNAQLTSYLVESVNGMETIKAYAAAHRDLDGYRSQYLVDLNAAIESSGSQLRQLRLERDNLLVQLGEEIETLRQKSRELEGQLADYRLQLADRTIKAPIDGVVNSAQPIAAGDRIEAGARVMGPSEAVSGWRKRWTGTS